MRLTKEQAEKQKETVLTIFRKSSPILTQKDIIESTGWNQRTVNRYLSRLVKERKIVVYKKYSTVVLYRLSEKRDLKYKLYRLKRG